MGLFDCGGRFYHVTYLSDSSDQLAVTHPKNIADPHIETGECNKFSQHK